jgi:proteasome lid subunit RPN8/RPN11
MWQSVFSTARRLLNDVSRSLLRERLPQAPPRLVVRQAVREYQPLERVVLTDGVGRTLFEEYAEHRAAAAGEEETGWFLLGLRERNQAVVLATLPAGTQADASATHVRFNSAGQVVGSLIVRQHDRRLAQLGVVHTHPGSLRHPSDADFRGDREWVETLVARGYLRGKEGIFGIGTADGHSPRGPLFAEQPHPHVQCLGDLRLSWYALGDGDAGYRPLPVGVTLGPDLARPLHAVWVAIEAHAERLERLYRQQAGVTFGVVPEESGPWLAVNVPVAEPATVIRVLLRPKEARYFLVRNGEMLAVNCLEDRVDRGVYLLLAELAAQD